MTVEEIKECEVAVLRFTATWCPPCKALAPIFDEVASENPGVKVFVIDVDDNPEIANYFAVRGIPSIMKTKNGQVVKQASGARPKPELEEFFK